MADFVKIEKGLGPEGRIAVAGALDDLASHMDLDQYALAGMTEDHKEGVAAFLNKRKPRFKGR